MNDFNGSVAQQDVSISTEVKKTTVVGGNFYDSVIYVTDRFSDFGENTPKYPVVSKSSYEDVIEAYSFLSNEEKAIIKANLASLFSYGSDLTVYILPSSEVKNYKLYAYFTYLDLKFVSSNGTEADYSLDETAETTIDNLKAFDKEFTFLIADMPVDTTKVKGVDTTSTGGTASAISSKTVDMALWARPAMPVVGGEEAGTSNVFIDASGEAIGPSPALYQLGRALGRFNESGTPVGNAFDMDAMNFLNVLPTGDTDIDVVAGVGAVFANFFESSSINYFKPVGNGTMQITNFGGWTILRNCIGAQWIVAYLNYVNRVACATIITNGKSLKNPRTYSSLLDAMINNIKRMMKNGRITDLAITAPSFSEMPETNGSTIIIPDAWSGSYVDNVRKVKISGSLTVSA